MRIDTDQWGEIAESLSRNKTRTILTAFGIFWGVFMLMILMGGGQGLKQALGKTFAGFASNSGFIINGTTSEPYDGFQSGRTWTIDINDAKEIKRRVKETDVVTPVIFGPGTRAIFKDKDISVNIIGFTEEYNRIEELPVLEGRLINSADNNQRRKVCIIGKRIQKTLFGDSIQAIGQYIELDGVQYQVVGINRKEGNGIHIGGNPERSVFLPQQTLRQVYNRHKSADVIAYTIKDGYKVSDVQEKIADVMRRIHHISPTDNQAVLKINAEAIFEVVDSLFKGISILIWMIGLGTLLAGAIGVSNIMMVTIKERTSEIGIRRAIGARPVDILIQTMSESIVLTLVAGMCGISLAVLCLYLIESNASEAFAGANFQVPFYMAICAALLLSILGVIAGAGPTLRAMSIKPVDAMREE